MALDDMPASSATASAEPSVLQSSHDDADAEKGIAQQPQTQPDSSQDDDDSHNENEEAPPKLVSPDGGLTAWLVILGGWCASFCTFGWVNSIGIFQEYYQDVLLPEYSASTIAWIPSLQIFFMMALGPFVGWLYDRYGPRWLLLGGSFLHVFGIMMASISTEYYQILLSQGLCSGLGMAGIFSPAVTCAAGWFTRHRGIAFGVLFTGSSLGGIIFPIMVTHLIQTLGYGWAMRICGFLLLALLVVMNLTVHNFFPPSPTKISGAQLVKPFTESLFLLLAFGFFCFTFGYYVPINYLPSQALSAGMAPSLEQYIVTVLNAGSLFGRLAAGVVGDIIGLFNVFLCACFLTAIWILALWIPGDSDAALLAFAVLFGFSSGAYVSLITPIVMQVSPLQELGFRTGIVLLFCAVAGLITNPIGGAILGSGDDWLGLQLFCGLFCVVGSSLILTARFRETGFKVAVKI